MRNTVDANTFTTGLKRPMTNFREELSKRGGQPDARSGRLRALLKLETRREEGRLSRRPALIVL
ncbi:hypothetical protein [Aliiroseovarius sp. 2305UL8-7]|uniref:hypothetical protein n=1 Tax=Aliiroseovarius conchicola TaxID=3121637 RepID=UPI00352854A6